MSTSVVTSARILMADDDPDDLELVEQVITELLPSAAVVTFEGGQPALDFLATCQDADLPHLIILDYNMPYATGAEILARLKAMVRFAHIPKVILSTSDAPRYVEESLRNGAIDYFVKPSNLEDLNKLAKQLLTFCRVEV